MNDTTCRWFHRLFPALALTIASCVAGAGEVRFNRDIRPILSDKCFKCHGPDANHRKADMRLDTLEGALADLGDYAAVVPGAPGKSELIARITTGDEDDVMPPPDTGKTLSDDEKKLFRDWIAQGGEYEAHWAYIPPKRPPMPTVSARAWPSGAIDRFILARIESANLSPSPQADAATLARRLHFDLTGLPPSPRLAKRLASDTSPEAYARVVDELLASPRFGERLATYWLDLVRYADTVGYHGDQDHAITPYRDWVIKAFNDNLPFDQFTAEQLAGDLLPNATQAQRIATGFHRNTMVNEEGGIDPLEFRFYAMVDRVNTTATTWLGLTLGCAQCHTHKFDPVPHRSYYEMMAFLNNAAEPELAVSTPAQIRRSEEIEKEIAAKFAKLPVDEKKFAAWLAAGRAKALEWDTLTPKRVDTNLGWMELQDDGSLFVQGDTSKHDTYELEFKSLPAGITALRLEALPDERLPKGGPGRAYYEGPKGDFFLSELKMIADGKPVKLSSGSENYAKQWIGKGKPGAMAAVDGDLQTGWSANGREGKPSQAVWQLSEPLTLKALKLQLDFSRHYSASLGRFRISVTASKREAKAKDLPAEIEILFAKGKLNVDEKGSLRNYYIKNSKEMAKARKPIEDLRKQIPKAVATLVMQERPAAHPRATHRHHRGEFLSPREAVTPKVLPFLPPLGREFPRDRLGFARWLVDKKNPLTARVVVNRHWAAFFGEGIVTTPDDFGYTGAAPTNPELLDWLAIQFIRGGWSQKKLHRLIVTSATYRQARSARYRLSSEQIRDSVLRVSELLNQKIGGPSVFPPQPKSMGEGIYGGGGRRTSRGNDRYRRSLYTYKKRSMPFAMHDTFDGPSHETCVARRETSNTPLQALTLLNDPFFIEAAQKLGQWAAQQKGGEGRIVKALFEKCLTRPPDNEEQAALIGFYQKQLQRFKSSELEAGKIAGKGKGDVTRATAKIKGALAGFYPGQSHEATFPVAMEPEALEVVDEIIARCDGIEEFKHFFSAFFVFYEVALSHREEY